MMRRPAGFDADPRRRQLLKELNNLPPPQLLAQHRLLGRIHTMQLKNTLGRVHSNADKIVHGRPPCLRSTTTSFWHIDAVGGRPPQQPPLSEFLQSRAKPCAEQAHITFTFSPAADTVRFTSASPITFGSGLSSIEAVMARNSSRNTVYIVSCTWKFSHRRRKQSHVRNS